MKKATTLLVYLFLMQSVYAQIDIHKSYYKSGALSSAISMEGARRHGESRFYYESGTLMASENYKNSLKHGEFKSYFKDGQLHQVRTYANDELDGSSREYFSNGQLKMEFQYVNGNLEGYARSYSETGEIINDLYYIDNKVSGTLTACDGAAYFVDLLRYKQDLLKDEKAFTMKGKNIKGFHFSYFVDKDKTREVCLDYIKNLNKEKDVKNAYDYFKNSLIGCMKSDNEVTKATKVDVGGGKQVITSTTSYTVFHYNKYYDVKLSMEYGIADSRISIYIIQKK